MSLRMCVRRLTFLTSSYKGPIFYCCLAHGQIIASCTCKRTLQTSHPVLKDAITGQVYRFAAPALAKRHLREVGTKRGLLGREHSQDCSEIVSGYEP